MYVLDIRDDYVGATVIFNSHGKMLILFDSRHPDARWCRNPVIEHYESRRINRSIDEYCDRYDRVTLRYGVTVLRKILVSPYLSHDFESCRRNIT